MEPPERLGNRDSSHVNSQELLSSRPQVRTKRLGIGGGNRDAEVRCLVSLGEGKASADVGLAPTTVCPSKPQARPMFSLRAQTALPQRAEDGGELWPKALRGPGFRGMRQGWAPKPPFALLPSWGSRGAPGKARAAAHEEQGGTQGPRRGAGTPPAPEPSRAWSRAGRSAAHPAPPASAVTHCRRSGSLSRSRRLGHRLAPRGRTSRSHAADSGVAARTGPGPAPAPRGAPLSGPRGPLSTPQPAMAWVGDKEAGQLFR